MLIFNQYNILSKRSDLTSLLPEAVAAIQAQKLVKSPEELNGYHFELEVQHEKQNDSNWWCGDCAAGTDRPDWNGDDLCPG
ncbi:MAG: hypothetical protein BroJett015_27690 [Chloroflexota bacterium]|nr:MAG: hypothetical protein BroJett015_27690 [Chloroflexota bacterium]